MKLKYAFKRTITNSSASARQETKPEVPDGMLKKCNACKGAVFVDEVKRTTTSVLTAAIISAFMQGEESK